MKLKYQRYIDSVIDYSFFIIQLLRVKLKKMKIEIVGKKNNLR